MAQLIATNQLTLTNIIDGKDGVGHLTTWTFYKLSNSTSAPQVVPIGASTNLSHLGPNNAWAPFKELSGGTAGWGVIDFDKIAKSDIIPDKPFTWYLEASFNGVSNFNGSTDFNIKFENWYVNSSGSAVFNPLGTKDFQANKFSATNDTSVNNYFNQSITWTVPRAVYDAIPEGGFLNLRIRIDRFTKLFYNAKNSYVTYGTVPSDPAKRGLGNYSTYGWKASPEAVTQALPYLWIYQIQFYDNGREVAIPPTLIGTQGSAGVSISSVKPYFILSNTPTGVVRTSGTWSATPLTPTLSQKYVWTYLETTLSNGTKQYSEPYITGVYGDKGDQGTQGPPGKDGLPVYIHWAYSDNADGTGLTTSDNGQRYIGQYSDNTKTDSTDKTKYRWADRWAKIEVGTRNLWIQSKATGGFATETLPDNHITGQKTCYKLSNNTQIYFNIEPDFSPRLYQKVTFSAWIKYDNVVKGTNNWNVFNCFKHSLIRKNSSTGAVTGTDYLTLAGFTGTSDWKYISYTYDYSATTSYDQLKTSIRFNLEGVSSGNAWVTGIMIQFGTVSTGHEEAIEDIQADIDSKADQTLTLEQKRELEVRMGIIEKELKARALLAETEAWFEEYKKYKTALDTDKKASETKLADLSGRIDVSVQNLGDMSVRWNFLDTYMKPGNEGLMIGKIDGTTSIRVSDNRIAFYSGGEEVAFISNNTLEIENGIFTAQLQVGRFQTSQYGPNPDANIVRYVGGR